MRKLFNAIMSGVYISIGAIVYLSIENKIIASLFFATGILLVLNFYNMLYTRVVPLSISEKSYSIKDIIIALLGNILGCIITALAISLTRWVLNIQDNLNTIINSKLNDTPISLIIMGGFCGILVAYAVIISKKYNKGSFAQIFYVWLFISAFVLVGFDHIVANLFYFSLYAITTEFSINILYSLLMVLIGNTIGGIIIGLCHKQKPHTEDNNEISNKINILLNK